LSSPLFAEPTCCYGQFRGDVLKARKIRISRTGAADMKAASPDNAVKR
jgi:hypothetical protein